MTSKPSVAGVRAAAVRLEKRLPPTLLAPSAALSRLLAADVWLKVETVSPVSSFKLRGALNSVLHALEQGPVMALVTSSTGNHGQGVAYAAKLMGLGCDVFVPTNCVPLKKTMIALFGARVHEAGHDIDDAKATARTFAREAGALFIDDGDDLEVIHGAGTVGLEIGAALEAVDYLFVPMGSGSLAAGAAMALKVGRPEAQVIAVQADGSPAMHRSFHRGSAVEAPVETIGDCLVCRVPAALALQGILDHVDDTVLVSDYDLLRAMRAYLQHGHLLVEPGAAAPLAAAAAQRDRLRGKRVVLAVTGSNVGLPAIEAALEAGDLIPDERVGALA